MHLISPRWCGIDALKASRLFFGPPCTPHKKSHSTETIEVTPSHEIGSTFSPNPTIIGLMPFQITRRGGLVTLAAAFATTSEPAAAATETAISETFPSQPVELVREAVTVAHGNFKRLKELVDARPSLARASYDWGFGDWEDCLGAASHVGNREIAEYLIGKGARPTLYSATMLGQLDVVKAFVAAQPGCQKIPGPHSISLLAHAVNGKTAAEPVRKYLESLVKAK